MCTRAFASSSLIVAVALWWGSLGGPQAVAKPLAVAAELLSDAVFCEPNWHGQLGATLLQFSIWAFVLNYDYGVMARIERWVTRQPWYAEVQENYKQDDVQKIFPFADPGFHYVAFIGTMLHHGGGGLLMLAGMLSGRAWLWRHGMVAQVAGCDILDLFRIVYCKLFPPGIRPICMFLKSPMFVPLNTFHHTVGLCVGIPVNLYFSEHFDFQLFGLVMLGAPAITLAPGIILKTLKATEYPRLLKANHIWGFVTFGLTARTTYYFPAALRCFLHMWRSEPFCWQIAVPFAWALFSMSVFNMIVFGIQAGGLYKTFVAADEREERAVSCHGGALSDVAGPPRLCRSLSAGPRERLRDRCAELSDAAGPPMRRSLSARASRTYS